MNSEQIFSMALGLQKPWKIEGIRFEGNATQKELHIDLGFPRGSRFEDGAGNECAVHDTSYKTWRHMDFFQHKCFLHCKVPRIITKEGKVKLLEVPWARTGSGFTLLFEAFAMMFIENEMPVTKVARMLREDHRRIWTIFNYWIKKAYKEDNVEDIEQLGFDETSSKKGHKYVTIAVDLKKRRVIRATEGKGKDTIKDTKTYLVEKGVKARQIKHVSIDLSPAFIAGIKENFKKAEIHFDRFHVVKLLNEAMDKVRKQERSKHKEIKGARYLFLKNKDNLSKEKLAELLDLTNRFPTLGEAYRLKEMFNEIWEQKSKKDARAFLVAWCKEAVKSGIEPFLHFVRTLRKHKKGIVNFVEKRINNGVLEGINSKIQLAKRRARGFRSLETFINMIYFLCGKLSFSYPRIYV
jgi:transposase